MRTYWLSTHLGYACRHSGACCSSRWPIPIERDRAAGVQRAIDEGRVLPMVTPWLKPDPAAPEEVAGILAHRPGGACLFHGPVGCAIHSSRPRSCEHFPFVCVIDARGVHVTLSHYCPTAAEMLFRPGAPEVVHGPPIFDDGRVPEGLDAREGLPPTRMEATGPPRLMDWDEVTRWEQQAVHAVATEGRAPAAIHLLRFAHARAAVPPGLSWADAPPDVEQAWAGHVAPQWPRWTSVVGRYLASKVHASWALHLASGPADVMRGVDVARAVLQVEATRQCTRAGRALDKPLLKEAIRESDLLLVHYADHDLLVRS